MSSSQFSSLFLVFTGTEESFLRMLRQLSFNLEQVHFQAHDANEVALRSNFPLKFSHLVKCLTSPWGKMLALRCTGSRDHQESSLSFPGYSETEGHVNGVTIALSRAFLSCVFLFCPLRLSPFF